jgi:hypothetical protein
LFRKSAGPTYALAKCVNRRRREEGTWYRNPDGVRPQPTFIRANNRQAGGQALPFLSDDRRRTSQSPESRWTDIRFDFIRLRMKVSAFSSCITQEWLS